MIEIENIKYLDVILVRTALNENIAFLIENRRIISFKLSLFDLKSLFVA